MVKKLLLLGSLIAILSPAFLSHTVNAACPAPTTTYGSASYSAPAASSGTFVVWTRMMVPDTTNKTFSLSIGDTLCNVAVGNGAITPNQWTWVNYRDGNTASKISLSVTAGTYNVQLGGTAPGVKVDKIMLVQDPNCTPVNDGSNCIVSPDTQAPSAPGNLSSPSQTVDSISLAWSNSTDNIGVARYDVYRAGTKIGSSNIASYTDSSLQASTSYSYTVKAVDAAGNASAASNTLQISTKQAADTTPPTVSMQAPVNGATVSGTTSLSASAGDDRVVASVKFYLDDYTLIGSLTSAPYTMNYDTTKLVNGSHKIHAVATDGAGNSTSSSPIYVTVANTVADTVPPSAPSSLSSTAQTTSDISLAWSASTDNVGVTGYEVYRDGGIVATVNTTSYKDTALQASTTYNYFVKTIDAAGNRSSASPTIQVSTLAAPDVTPPVVALTAPAAGTVSGTVAMTATASDNKAVAYVDFYANGYLVGRDTTAPYLVYLDTLGAPNSTVPLYAVAGDTSSNSTTSAYVTVTISNTTPDTTPPSAPTGLLATAVSTSQINLSWTASTDNVGVVGYDVYRNNTKIATVPTPSFGDTGLAASTTYTYTVKALDAANNASAVSTTASATTSAVVQPATQTGALKGYVKNTTGSAIKGAKVSYVLNGYRVTGQTNRAGYYYFSSIPYATQNFTYAARGYISQTKAVTIDTSVVSQDVSLQKGK